jgi:PAS domain S-box-containing protein
MENVINIVHVEDDPIDSELVLTRLVDAGLNCRLTRVQTRDELISILKNGAFPDIILADFRLPRFDGISAMRLANELCPHVPLIFVSGTIGEDAAIEALTQGSTDYVLKQNLSRLPSVVRRALQEARSQLERKRAEESVRKLSKAIEQSPVSIIISDLTGKIEFVNLKFSEVTGYTFNEAIGQHTRIFKSGKTPAEEYGRLWKTITSGGVWRGEFQNRKKNGELFWEQATIAPVRDGADTITHYVAVKEDITERKSLEEQLNQTQKMEAVGLLAGGVAHDFNNMLGVILGCADMALDMTEKGSVLNKLIEQIVEAANRSADITRKLLAFARKQTIQPKILDLNKTINGMFILLRRLIGEDIELVWQPGENLFPVKMDSSQIDQILANLCVNAKDAIAGVGKITIATRNFDSNGEIDSKHNGLLSGKYVVLVVSDNGCGMDKKTLDKIFEPFFTTKGIGKGTGLGLATVYGIIQQNEGFINVKSEPGHGSTFEIFLPAHSIELQKMQEESSSPSLPRGNETILLVEDDSSFLEMVQIMVEDLGYRVLTSLSPKEAIRIAEEESDKINLLITDVVMPEMNGRDLMKHLASGLPQLKCLFMSGYTGDVITDRGVLDEGIHFIQKPFSKRDLAVRMRDVLDSKINSGPK